MKEQKLPRVLVFDINPWREDGMAHTMKNIFSCWDPDKVAQVFTKPALPYTKVASRFFQINERIVYSSVLKPWIMAGTEVKSLEQVSDNSGASIKRSSKTSGSRFSFMYLCRELLWLFGHWKGKKLDAFLKDYNPDLIFACIQPTVFSGWIEKYIIRKTGKPFVCYLADDNYSYDSCSDLWSYLHRFWQRKNVRWLSTHCKQMFVIVEKEKEDTDKLFGTDSVILTKGIDFSNRSFAPHPLNTPIKFVYTGSLIIGRDKTMAMIADAINEINGSGVKCELDIYSRDIPEDNVMERLNRGASHHKGFIPRSEVDRVQSEADVVVFAEALEGKAANIARLSFSTKITDYLANGKCILAVGKDYIAPIDYFARNDSAIIATDAEQIKEKIKLIVENPSIVAEYSQKAYDCAIRNHEKTMVDKRFIESMIKAYQS